MRLRRSPINEPHELEKFLQPLQRREEDVNKAVSSLQDERGTRSCLSRIDDDGARRLAIAEWWFRAEIGIFAGVGGIDPVKSVKRQPRSCWRLAWHQN
jgi:hypothetical protein